MKRPGVRKEVERIERDESALLDILLTARHEADLMQAQVAERMGTLPPAIDQNQLLDVQEPERPRDLEHPYHDSIRQRSSSTSASGSYSSWSATSS